MIVAMHLLMRAKLKGVILNSDLQVRVTTTGHLFNFACCLMRKEAANVDTKAASLLTCALNAMEVIPLLSVGKGSHNLVQGSHVMLLLTAMLNWFYDLL